MNQTRQLHSKTLDRSSSNIRQMFKKGQAAMKGEIYLGKSRHPYLKVLATSQDLKNAEMNKTVT